MHVYAAAEKGNVRRVQRAIKLVLEGKGCTERYEIHFVRWREEASSLARAEELRRALVAVRGDVPGCGWVWTCVSLFARPTSIAKPSCVGLLTLLPTCSM